MTEYVLVDPKIHAPAHLDGKGRCCGVKPIVYKRDHGPDYPRGKFCTRCSRKFDLDTGDQIPNWAWARVGDGFQTTARRKVPTDPRDPDPTKEGVFRDHNCWKCKDGALPCTNGNPRNCENLHARND